MAMDALLLKRFALFASLNDRELEAMACAFEEERFDHGARIFEEGDIGDKLYLIAEGNVRISQRLGETGEEALAVLGPGDYFGDMSLIDSAPRSADAVVDGKALLYSIARPVFIQLLKADSQLSLSVLFRFIHTLTARLRHNNEKIRALNIMSMW